MTERETEIDKFNRVAGDYSQLHAENVRASGEPVEYFAQYKIDCLKRIGVPRNARILDYGCGIGNLTTLLSENFDHVSGYDPSVESLKIARQRLPHLTFADSHSEVAASSVDVAVLSGVLHHVPVAERASVVADVLRTLKPSGLVVVFEHNPYNPLTRRAVETCPFDDDAVLLPPREVRALLLGAGATQVKQDYIVFFPRMLAFLRAMEPYLAYCPLGAQTMTIATRADAS